MTTVGYIRASHGHQLSAEAQRNAILDRARRDGLAVARIYADGPAKGREGRAALLRLVSTGQVSSVIIPSLCRLSATWPTLLKALQAFSDAQISLLIANAAEQRSAEHLLAAAPALLAARAALHREAAAVGRAKARARGVRFGRPRIVEAKIARAREALEAGAGIREAARRANISPASVLRLFR